MTKRHLTVGISVAFAALVAAVVTVSGQGRGAPPAATGYITGVVQGASGPEAGVWVIAETKDLPTNFIKIVVTDDQRPLHAARAAEPPATACGCAATAWSIRRRSSS